jgi:chemotaxis methyl-accepting protein methylase/GAF domain-containing protein
MELPSRFPIVGLGASAGGVEAFQALFQALPEKAGVALVVIPHLSKESPSLLVDIIARCSRLRVVPAEEGAVVQSDQVYVLQPGTTLRIREGRLRVAARKEMPGRHRPIDTFFRSLAEDQRTRAVGVLLSGTDSDGIQGLAAIKAEGGITFVQDPLTTAHPGMAEHAIQAGVVDRVLRLDELAGELVRLPEHPYVSDPTAPSLAEDDGENQAFEGILKLLGRHTGIDFHRYKVSTLQRRIARRLLIQKLDGLEQYQAFLEDHPGELDALYRDVLIMVTEFFREAKAFEILKKEVIPSIIRRKKVDQPVRLWVVGCSTGQEAYSLAIVLLESMNAGAGIPVQIFATDVNESDVERARIGLYPPTIQSEMSSARLQRFFVETPEGFQVRKTLREMIIFAKHDITRDPPFTRLDLITCRNVLIYFNSSLQNRLLPMFHYALDTGGFLMLGPSESVGNNLDLFDAVDKRHRIYAKRPVRAQIPLEFTLPGHSLPVRAGFTERPEKATRDSKDNGFDPIREADRILATDYAPASVILSADYQVIQFRGDSSRYLTNPSGAPSFDILRMARPGLAGPIRALVEQARKSAGPVRRESVKVRSEDELLEVELEVAPFSSPSGELFFIISIDERGRPRQAQAAPTPAGGPDTEEAEADLLRRDLLNSRDHLQSTIREKEATSEELLAAYEEIQSSNEELQSINEELETAKEELQSMNEELSTVNEEMQLRNRELVEAHDDLSNLLISADIPLVMLDSSLNIRRYTPGVQALLNIIPADVGRPVTDIRLRVDVPDLERLVTQSIDEATLVERDVQGQEGRWYSMRILPYRTTDHRVEGAVVSFVDIDELKRDLDRTAEAVRFSEARAAVNAVLLSTDRPDELLTRVLSEAAPAADVESALVVSETDEGMWQVDQVLGLPRRLVNVTIPSSELPDPRSLEPGRSVVLGGEGKGPVAGLPELLRSQGVVTSLLVPLSEGASLAGFLLFNHHAPSPGFSPGELDFADKLALDVSLALENVRLKRAEHLMAESLRARTRPRLAAVTGLKVGYADRTASRLEQVGGDFAELLPLPDGRQLLLIGDVSGKGVAATSVIDVVRGTILGLAQSGQGPAAVLDAANRALRSYLEPLEMVTACLVFLDLSAHRLTYSNAGHTAAVLCGDDCSFIDLAHGPPLGTLSDAEFSEMTADFAPGDLLVVYTDGLTETRGETELFGETRLLRLITERLAKEPDKLAAELVEEAEAFAVGEPADDIVVVAVTHVGP